MKTRESNMPDDAMWEGFFDPPEILRRLGLHTGSGDVVDFGCGYGTFAIPAARVTSGLVHALDIDPQMVAATQRRAEAARLANVRAQVRDFVSEGTGLADGSAGYAMLFNILHAEEPLVLLREARRVMTPAGRLAVIHWNDDPTTPRGPAMAIRPRPEMCRQWAYQAGFELAGAEKIDLPPYHYGILFQPARQPQTSR